MKKIFTLICVISAALTGAAIAQCTSSASAYDLVVTSNVALAPSGPQFTFGYVCAGGTLMDSTTCCTRLIHVESGGTYEAGPNAYGFLYLKSGAIFDAHGNNSFFMVAYETGATILNYTGPQSLCSPVTFPSANCIVGLSDNREETDVNIYPNPCTDYLTINVPADFKNETIAINDLTGRGVGEPVWIKNHADNKSLDVSHLAPGIYFVEITNANENKMTRKFIKL